MHSMPFQKIYYLFYGVLCVSIVFPISVTLLFHIPQEWIPEQGRGTVHECELPLAIFKDLCANTRV